MAITITSSPTNPSTFASRIVWGVTMDDLGSGAVTKKLGYRVLVGGTAVTPWQSIKPRSTTTEEIIDATDTVRRVLRNPYYSIVVAGSAVVEEIAGEVTLETKEYSFDGDTCETTETAGPSDSVYGVSSHPTPLDLTRYGGTPNGILTNRILWTRPQQVVMPRISQQMGYFFGTGDVVVTTYDKNGTQIAAKTFTGTANKVTKFAIGTSFPWTLADNVAKVKVTRGSNDWFIYVTDCDVSAFGEIYFLSRLGGWDTMPFERTEAIQGNRQYAEINKFLPYGSTNEETRRTSGRTAVNIRPTAFYQLRRPGAENETEAEWLLDFLNAGAHEVRVANQAGTSFEPSKFVITDSSSNVWEDLVVTGYLSYNYRHLQESA